MSKILISIKPKYVKKILNGTKRYEFRTKAAKEDVSSMIIYSTSPTMKVVAEAQILDVLEMNPNELWTETKKYGGIKKKDFDNYFKNRKVGYAYKLGEIKVFNEPQTLNDYGLSFAPQSFVYIK